MQALLQRFSSPLSRRRINAASSFVNPGLVANPAYIDARMMPVMPWLLTGSSRCPTSCSDHLPEQPARRRISLIGIRR